MHARLRPKILTSVDLVGNNIVLAVITRQGRHQVPEQKGYHHVDAAHERGPKHFQNNLARKSTSMKHEIIWQSVGH